MVLIVTIKSFCTVLRSLVDITALPCLIDQYVLVRTLAPVYGGGRERVKKRQPTPDW